MKNLDLKFIIISLLCFIASCTYNISMAHTEGSANDVIDDAASANPNVAPNITVPVSAIP